MCVVVVFAYLLVRTDFFQEILEKKFTLKNQLFLIVAFGLLAIYGTYAGIPYNGAVANIRDIGPVMAGLIGGPIVGLGAGLIGGIQRNAAASPRRRARYPRSLQDCSQALFIWRTRKSSSAYRAPLQCHWPWYRWIWSWRW